MMSRTTAPARPNPSSPWVIDTRDLGRRAGEMRRYHCEVELAAALGMDMIGVPAGNEVVVDVRLESVVEGVLVSGRATAMLSGRVRKSVGGLSDGWVCVPRYIYCNVVIICVAAVVAATPP